MTTIVCFHHVHGLTDGVRALADRWRAAGHTVHTPDLYDGHTFDRMEDGFAHVQQMGFDALNARALEATPEGDVVVAGLSLGAAAAEHVAASRDGVLGAVLLHGFVEPGSWETWPTHLPLQVHAMAADEFWLEDAPAANAYADMRDDAEIFVYRGDQHLFTDSSLPSYDAEATDLVVERTTAFLAGLMG